MTTKPFVGQSALANSLLDLIHTDICGLLNTLARGGYLHFITFTDDHSQYGYVYLMSGKLLNMSYLKQCPRHYMRYGMTSLASYKYLRVWGSPTYVKRLVGDKLDSRSSLCRFVGFLKETAGYYFYDLFEQKVFVSRNAVFLKNGFPADSRRDEVLLEETSEVPQ
ncbi:UNVERIFIED_CONTAM: hypothetical protein Sindi_2684800 [Sesamum indicum]